MTTPVVSRKSRLKENLVIGSKGALADSSKETSVDGHATYSVMIPELNDLFMEKSPQNNSDPSS